MSNARPGNRTQDEADRLRGEIEALRASRRRLAAASNAERRAIEGELHDGVQQHLAALAIDLQRLGRLTGAGDATAAGALVAEMTGIVREAFDEAARLATRIYPQLLEGRGLAGVLRSAADGFEVTARVDVSAGAGYPPEITAELFWAWIDALSSAAAGSEATMSVINADGGLTFEIGIARRQPDARLERLRDRLEALDGRVTTEDRPDGSSLAQGWLPIPR